MKALAHIAELVGQFSYLGVFFVSLFAGYLIPLPEEVVLLAVGYIGSVGALNVYAAAGVATLAILLGDCILFFLALRESARIEWLRRKVVGRNPKPFSIEHAGLRIFVLRFIAGLRFLSPIYSGAMKVSWRTFVLYDLLALLIYVPTLVFLGFHFHNSILAIVTQVEVFRHALFSLILLVVSIWATVYINRRLDRLEKKDA